MKEFHKVFAKATNKLQLAQLCKDAEKEIAEGRSRLDSMMLFDEYYNLNFSLIELARLGKFIETGKYLQEFKRYV